MTPNIFIAVSYITTTMTEIVWRLAGLGQLSLLLEASAPKPGNVNRTVAFSDTDYRHFLASASMMSRGLNICATRGFHMGTDQLAPEDARLGQLIDICVSDSLLGLNRKNTILGSILLYVPLTVAIAASLANKEQFSISDIENWLQQIIQGTTVEDTLGLYRAFAQSTPGGQNIKQDSYWSEIHRRYDFDNPKTIDNIVEDHLRLEDLFRLSSEIDEISKEWAEYFQSTLHHTFPYIKGISQSLEDIEEAIVQTFVWLLSKRPDGLIIKKAGRERAEEIQRLADEAIRNWSKPGDVSETISELDQVLRKEGNLLNPGTTADLVSAAVFCRLVSLSFP
jgi:triphosphoribosyl-dephospho-CoA synthase